MLAPQQGGLDQMRHPITLTGVKSACPPAIVIGHESPTVWYYTWSGRGSGATGDAQVGARVYPGPWQEQLRLDSRGCTSLGCYPNSWCSSWDIFFNEKQIEMIWVVGEDSI